jgi:hypothetical protein
VEIPATRETGRKVDEFVGEEIGEVIDSLEFTFRQLTFYYSSSYDLDVSTKYKPMLGIEKPVFRTSGSIQLPETLFYKDIVLRVLPNPNEPHCHVLVVMEVSLLFMKA